MIRLLAILLIVSLPAVGWSATYCNCGTTEPSIDNSGNCATNILRCDDFEDGNWALTGNNPTAPGNDGWNLCNDGAGTDSTTCREPPPPAVAHSGGPAGCDSPGLGGTGYAGCSISSGGPGGIGGGNDSSQLATAALLGGPFTTLYYRFYVRLSVGFDVSGEQKFISGQRFDNNGGIHMFGLGHNTDQMQLCPIHSCNNLNEGYLGQNLGNSMTISTSNFHWYFVEAQITLNTVGVRDGIWRLWMDDCGIAGDQCTGSPTLRAQHTNVFYRGTGFGQDTNPMDGHFQDFWGNPSDIGAMNFDNLVIASAGPIGFAGVEAADTWTIDSFTMILPSTCTQGACSDLSEVNAVASGTATGNITWERDTDCDASNGVSYTTISECANSSSCLTSNGAGSCDMSGKTPGTYTITVQSCRGTTPVCDTETATFQVLAPAAIPGTRGSGTYSISELLEMFNDPYAPAVAMR